jgi:general secretion pathway protein A
MFEAFFSLTGTPFSRNIPVEQLLETASRKELQGRLNHVAKTRTFGVFTGDAGSGKTTAIRKFHQGLDPNKYRIIYLSDSALTIGRVCMSWVMSPSSTGVMPKDSCKRLWPY